MSSYEDRSSDESDAGSLEDFIVNSDSEDSEVEHTGEHEADSLDVDERNIIESSVITCGVRRSTRSSRGRAPDRYVDDQYIRLMTEDIGSDKDKLSDSECEEYGEESDADYCDDCEDLHSESDTDTLEEEKSDLMECVASPVTAAVG